MTSASASCRHRRLVTADGPPAPGAWRGYIAVLAGCLLWTVAVAGEQNLLEARYERPVERYGHFALGRPHEYARLSATTGDGRRLVLDLPGDEVFEDLAPRVFRSPPDAVEQLLAIVSSHRGGARLVVYGVAGEGLTMQAQSAPIGRPMRWLNPVGIGDLDGDGRAEIAVVITPHIGGTLKVYRQASGALVEVATLGGFSNHVYGSPELRLSTVATVAGRLRLLVPDTSLRHLRIITLESGRLVESGRCRLAAPVTGVIEVLPGGIVRVGSASGAQEVVVAGCLSAD